MRSSNAWWKTRNVPNGLQGGYFLGTLLSALEVTSKGVPVHDSTATGRVPLILLDIEFAVKKIHESRT